MSVIHHALRDPERSMPDPALSASDALAAILVASISVDGALSVDEAARMEHVLSTSRLFQATAGPASRQPLEHAIALLSERGMQPVLAACARALPPELHATAFATAVDLVLCDGRVASRERAYIESLEAALGVDRATALKIIEVLVIKNRM
jgi:hypothetical protein